MRCDVRTSAGPMVVFSFFACLHLSVVCCLFVCLFVCCVRCRMYRKNTAVGRFLFLCCAVLCGVVSFYYRHYETIWLGEVVTIY